MSFWSKKNTNLRILVEVTVDFSLEIQLEIHDAGTVYNFDTIDVDEKPEVKFKCLKRMVGERGFEPPTPWSRTRCSTRLSHSPTLCGAGTPLRICRR